MFESKKIPGEVEKFDGLTVTVKLSNGQSVCIDYSGLTQFKVGDKVNLISENNIVVGVVPSS